MRLTPEIKTIENLMHNNQTEREVKAEKICRLLSQNSELKKEVQESEAERRRVFEENKRMEALIKQYEKQAAEVAEQNKWTSKESKEIRAAKTTSEEVLEKKVKALQKELKDWEKKSEALRKEIERLRLAKDIDRRERERKFELFGEATDEFDAQEPLKPQPNLFK